MAFFSAVRSAYNRMPFETSAAIGALAGGVVGVTRYHLKQRAAQKEEESKEGNTTTFSWREWKEYIKKENTSKDLVRQFLIKVGRTLQLPQCLE